MIHWRRDRLLTPVFLGFPCGLARKESACNAGDLGSIPGLERSPGEGKGYPLQDSGLENSMDCLVHGVERVRHDWATFTFTSIINGSWILSKAFSASIETEDEMAGWHHWLDGHESQWTPGVGDGQGGLACCDSWGRKELDTTERLIWSDLIWLRLSYGFYLSIC